jgi:hypothetical protein
MNTTEEVEKPEADYKAAQFGECLGHNETWYVHVRRVGFRSCTETKPCPICHEALLTEVQPLLASMVNGRPLIQTVSSKSDYNSKCWSKFSDTGCQPCSGDGSVKVSDEVFGAQPKLWCHCFCSFVCFSKRYSNMGA